jgi:hypothetical protein
MGFRGYNWNTFVKQNAILIIMYHIYTKYKYLQNTNIGYTIFTDLVARHVYSSIDYSFPVSVLPHTDLGLHIPNFATLSNVLAVTY